MPENYNPARARRRALTPLASMKPSPPHTQPDANAVRPRETLGPPTARRSIAAVRVGYVLALNLHQRHSRRLRVRVGIATLSANVAFTWSFGFNKTAARRSIALLGAVYGPAFRGPLYIPIGGRACDGDERGEEAEAKDQSNHYLFSDVGHGGDKTRRIRR